MSIFEPAPQPWPDRALAVLRIVTGLLFLIAGTMKAFSYPPSPVPMPPMPVFSQIWIGAWMEVIGGILILIGLFTRPVAFLLAGEMAVAYWQFHAPQGTWPIVNGGQPAVLFCFLFLYLAATGAGRFSVDQLVVRFAERTSDRARGDATDDGRARHRGRVLVDAEAA